MKEHIKKAVLQLLETPGFNQSVGFKYKKGDTGKTFTARVKYDNNRQPVVELRNSSGYNEKYLLSKLKLSLSTLTNEAFGVARSGDIVLTRRYINPAPAAGTVVNLGAQDYYYGVNGGSMNCNGNMLGQAYQARFIKVDTARCAPGAEIANYSHLKLL